VYCGIKKFLIQFVIIILLIFSFSCKDFERTSTPEPPVPSQESPKTEPTVKQEWKDWIKNNHHKIRSLSADDLDFSDLQFLHPLIGDRRLVQLGESSHGVSQFNQAKVRLIKFLHQEMGFDVIAFESSIYESFFANENADSLSALDIMKNSIYGVWHCQEALELFKYIKETRDTSRPLILAGFDIQISSSRGIVNRPENFEEIVAKLDPVYAKEVLTNDKAFLAIRNTTISPEDKEKYKSFYAALTDWFDLRMDELLSIYANNPRIPLVMRQTSWSMIDYIDKLSEKGREKMMNIRDKGMAGNVFYLLNTLYPEEKIMIWAHNYHIQYDIAEWDTSVRNMGSWLINPLRDELYTIGLFMYEGMAAYNDRKRYNIKPAYENSFEAIMYYTGDDYNFVDVLYQEWNEGNSWMFEKIPFHDWGILFRQQTFKNQLDAILFVKEVKPPDYL
jgi:erythromycin esterase